MANEAEACEARRLWVAYLALDGFWSGDHACVAEEGQAGGMPGLTGGTLRAQAGTVRGEDYNFHFSGRVREGKLHFRLHMEYEGDEPAQDAPRHRTIDFVCAARAARARLPTCTCSNAAARAGVRAGRCLAGTGARPHGRADPDGNKSGRLHAARRAQTQRAAVHAV